MWRMWKIYTPTNLPAQYNQSLKASLCKLQVLLTADFKIKTCCFRLRKQCTDLGTDCSWMDIGTVKPRCISYQTSLVCIISSQHITIKGSYTVPSFPSFFLDVKWREASQLPADTPLKTSQWMTVTDWFPEGSSYPNRLMEIMRGSILTPDINSSNMLRKCSVLRKASHI